MSNHGDEKERRRYLRIAADEGLGCAIEGVDIVHILGISAEGGGMRVITNNELPDGVSGVDKESRVQHLIHRVCLAQ